MTAHLHAQAFVEKQLAMVRPRFLATLSERLDRMEGLRDILDEDRRRREPLLLIRADAHKTVGVAATLGYPELGRIAREAEAALDRFLADDAERECDDDLLSAIDSLLGEMALIVEANAA